MTANDLNNIISVFVRRNVIQLSDSDLDSAVGGKDDIDSPADVCRVVQTCPSLFQLRHGNYETRLVQVEPKVAICQDFLDGKCPFKTRRCNQLHLCRAFGHCSKTDCRSPHDFTRGQNRHIVLRSNCANVDPVLLVRLLRLHKRLSDRSDRATTDGYSAAEPSGWTASVQPKLVQQNVTRSNGATSRGRSRRRQPNRVAEVDNLQTPIEDIGCELKISCPITSSSRDITIEDIQVYLSSIGLPLGKIVYSRISQEYYQWTVKVEENSIANELLRRSIISYNGISLKFKPARPPVDTYSFVLRSTIDVERGPIRREALTDYIDHLLDRNAYVLTDLSTVFRQIFLVQCEETLDFNQLCRLQKIARQLQGANVTLARIHEVDTITVESALEVFAPAFVQHIFEFVWEDIFTLKIVSEQQALVEFIDWNALKKYLQTSDQMRQELNLILTPMIQYVDNDNVCPLLLPAQPTEPEMTDTTTLVAINLRTSWAMIANHSVFGTEYKDYLESELGAEVKIHGNRVEVRLDPRRTTLASATTSTLLNDRASSFMKTFAIRSMVFPQRGKQLDILQAHSSIVAFHRSKDNNYILATKKSDMHLIMPKLLHGQTVDQSLPTASPVDETSESFLRSRQPAPIIETQQTPVIPPKQTPLPQRQTTVSVSQQPASVASSQSASLVTQQSAPRRESQISVNAISATFESVAEAEIVTMDKILSTDTPAQQVLFADTRFESQLQTYFSATHGVKFHIDRNISSSKTPVAKFTGRLNLVNSALSELSSFMPVMRTKTFSRVTDDKWIQITKAVDVIQYLCNSRNFLCVCQHQASPLAVLVHYIDDKQHKLGASEGTIETLCRTDLVSAVCSPVRYDSEWMALQMRITQSDHYCKGICLVDASHSVILYGEPHPVRQVQQQFEQLNQKHVQPIIVPLLTNSTRSRPEQSPIVSPPEVKTNVVPKTNPAPAQIPTIVFTVDVPGFELFVSQNWNGLGTAVGSKCSIAREVIHNRIQIQMPKEKVDPFDDNTDETESQEKSAAPQRKSSDSKSSLWSRIFRKKTTTTEASKPTAASASANSTSTTTNEGYIVVGNSKLIVLLGDLTNQAVDVVVVCSTSRVLCDAIVTLAGYEVQNIYRQQSTRNDLSFETPGGMLPCKQIAFRPWVHDKSQGQELKESIKKFITSAISYALQKNFRTIAFPSIGCGQLGYEPKLIAEHMLGETYELLRGSIYSPLTVSFVLLPQQKNVHDVFVDQLKTMRLNKDVPTTISFDRQTVKFTLTGSSTVDLNECEDKIKQLAVTSSTKVHLTARNDAAEWPQDAIQKFYDYCLQRRVIPALDIQKATLDLSGPKDAVTEADRYYFQLTAEVLRNARIKVVARGVVWFVEVRAGQWEQYSYQISEQIEAARTKTLPYVEFKNDKHERCRIDFVRMEERSQTGTRKVRCKRIDSSLPDNWDPVNGNSKRVILSNSSQEYKDVLAKFETTMRGSYRKIITIERIQNERWYKQYHAHREEFSQRYGKPDERLLFHGCSKTSADKIINECFNRAFAGVNGVLYGCGVYFHEHAQYSASYTREDVAQERTMFLARVLVGKTCLGTSTMKVPPPGFDTTTDGKHIFVVYHDAGAYAEYLITYA